MQGALRRLVTNEHPVFLGTVGTSLYSCWLGNQEPWEGTSQTTGHVYVTRVGSWYLDSGCPCLNTEEEQGETCRVLVHGVLSYTSCPGARLKPFSSLLICPSSIPLHTTSFLTKVLSLVFLVTTGNCICSSNASSLRHAPFVH